MVPMGGFELEIQYKSNSRAYGVQSSIFIKKVFEYLSKKVIW